MANRTAPNLRLSRETVRELDQADLGAAAGGQLTDSLHGWCLPVTWKCTTGCTPPPGQG
ncbi:MAG TPA: hypothetical protein VG245_10245 [Candidatus Dormibacteraeota bacterium]|jgi:hypothetical protein|nr:hypothetical protein [Candidatus Dormibacteraeota bacterium]